MSAKEIARIEQIKLMNGRLLFVLYDDGIMVQSHTVKGTTDRYSYSIAGYDPEPTNQKNEAKFHVKIALLCAAAFLISFTALFFFSETKSIIRILFLLWLFGFMLFKCVRFYGRYSYDYLVFHHPKTKSEFSLHNNLPDEKTFSSFLATMKETMRNCPETEPIPAKSTADKLRDFAKLHDDGILTDAEFDEIKQTIISNIKAASAE